MEVRIDPPYSTFPVLSTWKWTSVYILHGSVRSNWIATEEKMSVRCAPTPPKTGHTLKSQPILTAASKHKRHDSFNWFPDSENTETPLIKLQQLVFCILGKLNFCFCVPQGWRDYHKYSCQCFWGMLFLTGYCRASNESSFGGLDHKYQPCTPGGFPLGNLARSVFGETTWLLPQTDVTIPVIFQI